MSQRPPSTTTPASDLSDYFDAPVAIFHSNMTDTEQVPPPVHGSYQLSDDPVKFPEKTALVQHPNGSEGWLPTENAMPEPALEPLPILEPLPTLEPLPLDTKSKDNEFNTAANTAANAGYSGTSDPSASLPPPIPSRSADEYPVDTSGAFVSAGSHRRAGTTATTATGASSLGRSASRRSAHTASNGRAVGGSAFVNGAGATGPLATAEVDGEQTLRAQEAGAGLSPKQKSKIGKQEAKNGKRLSRIIKSEGKMEKKSLEIAIADLDSLQKLQKNAIKTEARLQATHAKHLSSLKQREAAFLSAKLAFDTARAQESAAAEALEATRANAREATVKMQDKAAEVDALRRTLAVDERERAVKLGELGVGKKRGWLSRN